MDRDQDLQKIELEIEQAKRLASAVADRTTSQRLWDFVQELKQRRKRRLAVRRAEAEIRTRAHQLWVQHGRPDGRHIEFWQQAEGEIAARLPDE